MILLCLTASTDRGGLALFKNGKLLIEKTWTRKSGSNSERLTSELAKSLKSKKLKISDISSIALDVGPGSFTGCRIAANIAKTIAQSFGIQIAAITSLAAIEEQNPKALVILDAHKSLYYVNSKGDLPNLLTSEQVLSLVKKGQPVAGVFGQELKKNLKTQGAKFPKQTSLNFPMPRTLGRLVFSKKGNVKKQSWFEVEPLYIRAPQAVENLRSNPN